MHDYVQKAIEDVAYVIGHKHVISLKAVVSEVSSFELSSQYN